MPLKSKQQNMGQSISVAFKSIRAEYRRYQRKRKATVDELHEDRQHILAASAGSTPLVVAFEDVDERNLPDPPFL